MSLFPTLAEYFMYSHLPYFLYIVAMLCSSDDKYIDEDFFYSGHLPVVRWYPFYCLVLSGLVTSFCKKI
jgi:hypothetical protein